MNINQGGRMRLLVGTLVATVAAAGGLAGVALGDPAHEHAAHEHAARAQASDHEHMAGAGADTKLGGAALRLHDRLRKLWEDHITWTRLTIVSFAAELPDLQPTLERLLRNQQDIGDAIEPFYGPKAADRLTALLTEHINGAVMCSRPRSRATSRRSRPRRGPGMRTVARSPTSSTMPTPATGTRARCAR
jgi:hypothetical protein